MARMLNAREQQIWLDAIQQLVGDTRALGRPCRLLASEARPPQVRKSLEQMGLRLEQGLELQEAIRQTTGVPPFITGILAAATRSRQFDELLSHWVERHDDEYEQRKLYRRYVGYPLTLLVVTLAVTLGICAFVAIQMIPVMREFQGDFSWLRASPSDVSLGVLAMGCLIALFLLLSLLLVVGLSMVLLPASYKASLLARLPWVGRLSWWTPLSRSLELTAMLIRCQVPLPEAFRLAAWSEPNSLVTSILLQWADEVERGADYASVAGVNRRLPRSLLPFLRWGASQERAADSLQMSADYLRRGIIRELLFLRSAFPPLIFAMIAACVISLIYSVMAPITRLLIAIS